MSSSSTSDRNHGRGVTKIYGEAIGDESISSKFGAVGFQTPEPGDISLGNVTFETPDSAIGRLLRQGGTPRTVAPKITRIQRERAAMLAKRSSRSLQSVDSKTTEGDTTMEDIILHLNADAEAMNSSMIRKNSKGRIMKPTEDDDIFDAPPIASRGKSLGWMHRRPKIGSPETFPPKTEDDTPTKDPKKKDLSSKGHPEKEPKKKDPSRPRAPKKELGIPFPNLGRFWCAKYSWEEVQGNFVVEMFEQCDPEDKDRVKKLYELAWVIKVSTAMVQCDIQDQTRVQQLVQWSRDFWRKNDWQCSVPLGWNLKQQQYVGPRPSDEERQRFVDYAWQMNQNQVTRTWDKEGKRKYDEAALEVFAFRNKYPDFPHDYPPGYPGENANFKSDPLYRRLSHFNGLPVTEREKEVEAIQRSRNMKRKVDEDLIQELPWPKKKTKIPAVAKKVVPRRKRATTDTDVENPRRSGHYKSPIHYGA